MPTLVMNVCTKDGQLTIYATWHHSAKLAKIFNKQLVLNKKHTFLFNTSNKMNKTELYSLLSKPSIGMRKGLCDMAMNVPS